MDLLDTLLQHGIRIALVAAAASQPSRLDDPAPAHWMTADGAGGASFVTLANLDPKAMPVAVEADEDGKDVKLRARRKYKPAKHDETLGEVPRLELRARDEAASVCLLSEFAGAGMSSTHVRVAVDGTQGLVDGESLGFLELRLDSGEAQTVLRVEAVWDAASDGFLARATEDGEPAGSTAEHPGAKQLQLEIGYFGSEVTLSASVPGEFASADGSLHAVDVGADDLSYTGAFGAEGLDKGGKFYFDDLALYGDPNELSLTLDEKALAYLLQVAANDAGVAELWADPQGGLGNIAVARDWAGQAESDYDLAQEALDGLVASGTIDGQREKLLEASVKKGRMAAASAFAKAQALVEQGQGAGDTSAAVEKLAQKARNQADLATAQVLGLLSGNVSHVYDWAEF